MDFSADELANFRTAQSGHMMDTAVRQVYARTYNTFNEPIEAWTDQSGTIDCGLDTRPGTERHTQNMTTLEYDATLRLPIATVIDAKDRIKITHRFGEALSTALIFRIEGPIQRGPSGIRVLLRRVDV